MVKSQSDRRLSKFISLLLRHRPEEIGLSLDPAGWADLDELIARAREAGAPLSEDRLLRLLAGQEKPRFSLSDDGRRIRANYGHSLDVELGLEPTCPPDRLFHGTARSNLPSIRRHGLEPRGRRFVHLSEDRQSALEVGRRHGEPIVLIVRAAHMAGRGDRFYRPAPGVWLVARVPPGSLEEPGILSARARTDARVARPPPDGPSFLPV